MHDGHKASQPLDVSATLFVGKIREKSGVHFSRECLRSEVRLGSVFELGNEERQVSAALEREDGFDPALNRSKENPD